jgi:hypothetical protein
MNLETVTERGEKRFLPCTVFDRDNFNVKINIAIPYAFYFR